MRCINSNKVMGLSLQDLKKAVNDGMFRRSLIHRVSTSQKPFAYTLHTQSRAPLIISSLAEVQLSLVTLYTVLLQPKPVSA